MENGANLGLTEKLTSLLDVDVKQICLDAAWALTNIAAQSSKEVAIMLSIETHNKLVSLLCKDDNDIKEQSLWVLGNIVGDSIEARDKILKTQIVEQLILILNSSTLPLSLLKVCCWTISNLCRGKPSPDFNRVFSLWIK